MAKPGLETREELDDLRQKLDAANASLVTAAGTAEMVRKERDDWKAQARRLASDKEAMQRQVHDLTVECSESRKRERKLVDAVVRLSELVCGGCSRDEGY